MRRILCLAIAGAVVAPTAVWAQVDARLMSFRSRDTTGNQTVNGVGFQPKAALFWITDTNIMGLETSARFGRGFTDGVNQGSAATAWSFGTNQVRDRVVANRCITLVNELGSTIAEAEIVSFHADGFTLNWTQSNSDRVVHALLLGGPAITSARVGSVNLNVVGNGSTRAITGLGFTPDAILFAGVERSSFGTSSRGGHVFGVALSPSDRHCSSHRERTNGNGTSGYTTEQPLVPADDDTSPDARFDLHSLDPDGFTMIRDAGNNRNVATVYLALEGAFYARGILNQPAAAGQQTLTGLGFVPSVVMFDGGDKSADGWASEPEMVHGVATGSNQMAIWMGRNGGFAHTYLADSFVLGSGTSGISFTANAVADLVRPFVNDSFTLDWTMADNEPRRIGWLAIGALPGGASCNAFQECTTGYCVDGFCCDTECVGACATCSAARGAPTNGTCGPVTAGTFCRPISSLVTCDVPEACTGVDRDCPPDQFEPNTTRCRDAAGDCDLAEHCTGSSPICPPDLLAPPNTSCRGPAGGCDVAESCTGSSADCPPDQYEPSTEICRIAAGDCDLTERCSGTAPLCPNDLLEEASHTCRDIAGDCDVAENCTGIDVDCPTDLFLTSNTVCRMGSVCDTAERCTGTDPDCPIDQPAPNGTPCPDSLTCNGNESCAGGVCVSGPDLACVDTDLCTTDSCQEPAGCTYSWILGCCNDAGDCSDGDLCTLDTCSGPGGTCSNPSIVDCCNNASDCDDTDLCTIDSCSGPGGTCSNSPITNCCQSDPECEDGAICTTNTCDLKTNTCVTVAVPNCCTNARDCADGNLCTQDSCETSTGVCSNTPIADCCQLAGDCEDNDLCTQDTCPVPGGVCVNQEIADCCEGDPECDDDDLCTQEICNLKTNRCTTSTIAGCCNLDEECDDTDPCTADACDTVAHVCTALAIPDCCQSDNDCVDSDDCTLDICLSGTCEYFEILRCRADAGVDAVDAVVDAGAADSGAGPDAAAEDAEPVSDSGSFFPGASAAGGCNCSIEEETSGASLLLLLFR